MKLRFYNGRNKKEDTERLKVLNKAIRESGLQFAPFKLDSSVVRTFDRLCERMAIAPSPAEPMLTMFHFSGCPGLASAISTWNRELRRNLIIVLFSGESLSEATVKSVVEGGRKAQVAGMLWLSDAFTQATKARSFRLFFQWLKTNQASSAKKVFVKLKAELSETTSARPNCMSLAILCQGYLAACCEGHLGKFHEKTVKSALKTMGWPKLENNPELQSLKEKLNASWSAPIRATASPPKNPRDARWWLQPFRRRKRLGVAGVVYQLSQDVHEEWNNYPKSIDKLLRLIRQGNVNNPALVAQAYLDLTRRSDTRMHGR